MKKHLLTVLAALFTVTAMAQYSEETALELKGGVTNTPLNLLADMPIGIIRLKRIRCLR